MRRAAGDSSWKFGQIALCDRPVRAAFLLALSSALCASAACSSADAPSSGSPPVPGDAGTTITPPDGAPPEPVEAGVDGASAGLRGSLTVLTLNLHCLKTDGTAFATNDARFAAIAKAAADERVDVLLAQEVCVSATENARTMLTGALEKATGASWSSEVAFAHRAWEGTPDEADESVAVFSRGVLRDKRELVHRSQSALRRVSLAVTVESPVTTATGAPLAVRLATVHLDHLDAIARPAQAREVASAAVFDADEDRLALDEGAGAVSLPLVVGGDFNARWASPATKALVDFGFVESTASAATARIDHVFVHRSAPLVAGASRELFVGAAAVSDHPGVLVRFDAAPSKPVHLTRIIATGAFAQPLSVRGDQAPMTWDVGWPAFSRRGAGGPAVALVTSELTARAFSYKFLQGDAVWQTGANESGMGERDNTITPSFP